jgi:hypothetical protein
MILLVEQVVLKKGMLKIVFLDIDGVLNVIPQGFDKHGAIFHPHFVANLARLIDETGAEIVISSSWRHSGLDAMIKMWEERRLPGKIAGITPSHHKKNLSDKLSFKERGERGGEIKDLLDMLTARHEGIDIRYVILDDDDDVLPEQEPYFVKTSENHNHEDCIDIGYGLTKICTDKAIEILNGL